MNHEVEFVQAQQLIIDIRRGADGGRVLEPKDTTASYMDRIVTPFSG